MARRLLEKHPTLIKIRQLEQLAHDLGLTLSFHGYGGCFVDDKENKVTCRIVDIDDRNYPIDHFPYEMESHVIINEDESQ